MTNNAPSISVNSRAIRRAAALFFVLYPGCLVSLWPDSVGTARTAQPAGLILTQEALRSPTIASDLGIELSLSTFAGVTYGTAKELVYYGGQILSELDWPLQPAFTVGTRAEINTKVGLTAELSFESGINGKSGSMTDSDFLNGDGVRRISPSRTATWSAHSGSRRRRAGGCRSEARFPSSPSAPSK